MIEEPLHNLVPLRQVPNLLPKTSRGKRVHISTVYRWATRGVRGGVRLRTVKIGGTTYTSVRALREFSQERGRNDDHVSDKIPTRAAGKRTWGTRATRARSEIEKIFGEMDRHT